VKIEMLLEWRRRRRRSGRGGCAPGRHDLRRALRTSERAAAWFAAREVERVGLLDVNSDALPVALFGAAIAGDPSSR